MESMDEVSEDCVPCPRVPMACDRTTSGSESESGFETQKMDGVDIRKSDYGTDCDLDSDPGRLGPVPPGNLVFTKASSVSHYSSVKVRIRWSIINTLMNYKRPTLPALFVLLSGFVFHPQTLIAQRSQRPSATPARPAYMQYLKAYEENPMVTKVVLKNGLTVLVNEFKGAPVAVFSTFCRSGYEDEPGDMIGISDVLAHLIFGKTATRDVGIMGKDIRALGGYRQSEAALDSVRYDIVVPSGQWKKALELEADAILNPVFDPDEVTRAIDKTLEERHELLNPADELSRRRLTRRELIRGPETADSAGTGAALRSLTRDKLIEYYKSRYTPSNLILVASGDVATSGILTDVVRLYAKTAPGTEKKGTREVERQGFRYTEVRGDLNRPRIVFRYLTVSVNSPDFPALEVVRAMIGMGRGSAIARRLRDQKKVALGGRAEQPAGLETGELAVQLEVESKDIDRCEISALTELELIKRQEPDEGDLARAQALLEREYWDQLETVSGRAKTIGDFEILGDWKKMNGYLGRLDAVKASDVVRVAEKYLRLDRCSLVEYLPVAEEPRNLNSEKVLNVFQQLLGPAADQEAGERERETVPAVNIPKDVAPFKPSEIRHSFKTASILRGPDLFIREDHTLPLIHMGFFFPGGQILEKSGSEGITALMLDSMMHGTKEKDASQIFRQLEIYGGQLTPVVEHDYFGYRLSVLSSGVDGALDLIAQIVTTPKFDDEDIGMQKAALLDLVRRNKTLARFRAQELMDAAIFKGHPYAVPPYGTETTVSSLTPAAVRDWYKTMVEHKKPLVVIIGDTQGTSLAAFFVRNFSGSRFQEVKLPETYVTPVAAQGKLQEAIEGNASYVLLGFQAPPAGDEDYYPVEVLVHYLGGEGGALSDALRGICGLDCDVSVKYKPFERGGIVQTGGLVSPGTEDNVLKAVQDTLQKLPSAIIPYRDFRSAISQAVGRFNIEQQIRFTQIDTIVRNVLAGRSFDAIQDEVQRLQEVKQDDIGEYGQRILKLDKSVTVRLQAKSPDSK